MIRHTMSFVMPVFLMCALLGGMIARAAQAAEADTLYATGRFIMGDKDNRSDARQYALLDAKRQVIEQAGTLVRARSAVENFQLTDQEIQSYASAFIKTEILEETTEPVGETMAVSVKIRAIVEPDSILNDLQEVARTAEENSSLAQFQSDYNQLAAEAAAAEKGAPAASQSREKLARLNQLDLLIRLAAETNRKRPSLARVRRLHDRLQSEYPQPDFIDGYLGVAYYKHGQFDRAITYLNNALEKPGKKRRSRRAALAKSAAREKYRSELARFHYFLARSYARTGKKRLAKQHLAMARKLAPNRAFSNIP